VKVESFKLLQNMNDIFFSNSSTQFAICRLRAARGRWEDMGHPGSRKCLLQQGIFFLLLFSSQWVSERASEEAKQRQGKARQASSRRRRVVHRNPEFQGALLSCDFVLGRWVFFCPT
jgi:hypothetical protein